MMNFYTGNQWHPEKLILKIKNNNFQNTAKNIFSCNRSFILATGVLFLQQEFYSCNKNFIPATSFFPLEQDFFLLTLRKKILL